MSLDLYILIDKQPVLFDVDGPDGKIDPDRMVQWGENHEQHRRVAETQVGDVCVSTIWLGLDHNYFGGRPLLFETMTFIDGEPGDQWRYSTWGEAEASHMEIVEATQYMQQQAMSITRETLRSFIERIKQKDRK